MIHEGEEQARMNDTDRILNVMQAYKQELLSKANVVGIAVGFRQKDGQPTNTLALVVMVKQKIPNNNLPVEDQLPTSLDGIPIDVQEVGELIAH
jgi:hypothetical protein